MHVTYWPEDDILEVRFSDKPIAREVSECLSKADRYLAGYTRTYRSRQRSGKVQDLALLFGRQPVELLADLSFDCSVHITAPLLIGANPTLVPQLIHIRI